MLRLLAYPQSKRPNASLTFDDDIILDLRDPLLRQAGLESVMMDMLLHQFLLDSSGRRQLLGKFIMTSYIVCMLTYSQFSTIHMNTYPGDRLCRVRWKP
jgi:hypothetical protein